MIEMIAPPQTIVKRDGRVVPFDPQRIDNAIIKCFNGLGKKPLYGLSQQVVNILAAQNQNPTVEDVQDIVEMVLQSIGEYDAAKAYILYRHEHAKQRKERPIPDSVKQAFEEDKLYFPSVTQSFQFYDKYSRFNYELGRRETWVETVDRAVSYLQKLSNFRLLPEVYERIRAGILQMRATPSMRLLAMAGEAARRQNLAIYNCSALSVSSIDAFVEALIISMAGCGVGFSVESKFVDELPRVKKQNESTPVTFVILDTTEGWADALRFGLNRWFNGLDVVFDYSQLRPAGTPLKIKGGRSSGAGPFRSALTSIRAKILTRQNSFLRPIDAHDIMCLVGNAAVSGGVRHTAMISLFDYDDNEMLNSKRGNFSQENNQRWNANNSFVWPEHGMSQLEFSTAFLDMVKSGNGEPGIFSRIAANNTIPGRRKKAEFLTNPCFSKGTIVHTKDGHFPIESLVGKTVQVWDGIEWKSIDNFRVTAKNQPMVKITLQDGTELRTTYYHNFITEDNRTVTATNLIKGDKLLISNAPESHGNASVRAPYLKGFLIGDGTRLEDRPLLYLYSTKYICQDRLIESASELERLIFNTNSVKDIGFTDEDNGRKVMVGLAPCKEELLPWGSAYKHKLPDNIYEWNKMSKLEFLAGFMDADGTATDTSRGFGYQITSINKDLLLGVQLLLKSLGVNSRFAISKLAGEVDFGDGYGPYDSKDLWRLTISQKNSIILSSQIRFSRITNFSNKSVAYTLKPKFNSVADVEFDGLDEDVYCCTVEDTHRFALSCGIITGQCGEIFLRDMELCNLSIAIARADDTFESLKDKVELATIIGTIQSMATNFPGLRSTWRENCEEERLLGVDINGQMDSRVSQYSDVKVRLREHAVITNLEYSKFLGVNQSVAVTCVKPSGNSSQLFNCSSGIHTRWSPYYIRNMRISAHSPIYKVFKDFNVPMSPENGQTEKNATTFVIHFPVKSPNGAITRKDKNVIEQCEFWLSNKTNWTEHNPSVTITYKPDEVIDLMKWVWEHQSVLGGMSFLPADDASYENMPYIEISRAEYERLSGEFPVIDFSKIYRYEGEDLTTAAQENGCVNGLCEISFEERLGAKTKQISTEQN